MTKRLKDLTDEQAKKLAARVGLRYVKRDRQIKNSTGTFSLNLDTENAYSYNWWRFLAYNEKLGTYVFNNYSYSNSTAKHQNKLWSIMYELKMTYTTVFLRDSLDSFMVDNLKASVNSYIKDMVAFIEAPRKRKKGKAENLLTLMQFAANTNSLGPNHRTLKALEPNLEVYSTSDLLQVITKHYGLLAYAEDKNLANLTKEALFHNKVDKELATMLK